MKTRGTSKLGNLLFNLYKYDRRSVRMLILKLVGSLEEGEFYSTTLRRIFSHYYEVDIGLYTYGGCFELGKMDRLTTIGRFGSIAWGVRVLNTNHPANFQSTHPFMYNPLFGYTTKELIEYVPTTIGHDVWLGHSATIMPKVKSIGDGAIVGAGAIVVKDVPPFAIVAGNPAHIIRYRFPPSTIERIIASQWWMKPMDELKDNLEPFMKPFE